MAAGRSVAWSGFGCQSSCGCRWLELYFVGVNLVAVQVM